MSGAHINWSTCPACGRNKATGRSIMVALDDASEVLIGGKHCQAKGCHAESIRGVVIRAKGMNIRNNREAAEAVADAILRQAADHRREAANLLEEADREDALARRVRALHD